MFDFRSQDKHFHGEGSLTHVFVKSTPVVTDKKHVGLHIGTHVCKPIKGQKTDSHPSSLTIQEKPDDSVCKSIKPRNIYLENALEACQNKTDIARQMCKLLCKNSDLLCCLCLEKVSVKDSKYLKEKLKQNDLEDNMHPVGRIKYELIKCLKCLKYISIIDDSQFNQEYNLIVGYGYMYNKCAISKSKLNVSAVMNLVYFHCSIDDIQHDMLQIFQTILSNVSVKVNLNDNACKNELSLVCILKDGNGSKLASCQVYNEFIHVCIWLDQIAVIKYQIDNIRLLWSKESRILNELHRIVLGESFYITPSLYPPTWQHDMSFWVQAGQQFDDLQFSDIIREIAGDLVADVELIDTYEQEDTKRTSYCYRVVYHSHDRALPYLTSHELQNCIRIKTAELMGVVLR